MIQEPIRWHEIHQTEIIPFLTLCIQKNNSGNTFDVILLQHAFMKWIASLGDIHFDHGKMTFSLLDDIRMMKGNLIQLPAGTTPIRRKIDNHWLVCAFCGHQ